MLRLTVHISLKLVLLFRVEAKPSSPTAFIEKRLTLVTIILESTQAELTPLVVVTADNN